MWPIVFPVPRVLAVAQVITVGTVTLAAQMEDGAGRGGRLLKNGWGAEVWRGGGMEGARGEAGAGCDLTVLAYVLGNHPIWLPQDPGIMWRVRAGLD